MCPRADAPQFVLAPMDGMTRASFRTVCFGYGADGATTEMIQSLAYGRAKRRLSATFLETLVRFPEEGDLAAQLIGSNPAMMAASARKLCDLGRFDAIEINMGCPARKVVGSGNGAALLRDPERAVAIMRAVRDSSRLPVRLKLRLGWDEGSITAPELVRVAEEMGFERVTVHGRTRVQRYAGPVDIDAIRAIAESVQIPIYANGGVTCARDALAFLEQTRSGGVSVGRAALKQPWIFEDIKRLRAGETPREHDAVERVDVLLRLARLSCLHRPERVAVCEMRKFAAWLLPGLTGAADTMARLNHVFALEDFNRLMEGYLDGLLRAGDTRVHPELNPRTDLDTLTKPLPET